MSHVMNTYNRLPVAFERGEGVWLWDVDGHQYLDALAGIAVNGLGHAHPRLVQAIAQQAGSSTWHRHPHDRGHGKGMAWSYHRYAFCYW